MNLNVNEIFYSLQGEGGRQGEASIFIRLTACNLKCDFCDTIFNTGQEMSEEEILQTISKYPCQWIIWTGGEPCLQLSDEILLYFQEKGYKQAIESNGHFMFSPLLDYTVCSPKGKDTSYAKKINSRVDEIRLPLRKGEKVPETSDFPQARYYFLSPIFSSDPEITRGNIDYCVEQILQHPDWRLSLQIHKLIGIA